MSTNINAKNSKYNRDIFKWLVVIILLLLAIIGNFFYRNFNLLLRSILVFFIISLAGIMAMFTTQGRSALVFAREARTEIRKVIWPTLHETFYTTLIVAIVTVVMSLILWGLDSILVRMVSFITDLRF
ncbi:Protein translocase subunit SecE [Candidatus Profftia lariciata]|uniref:preprotein translocase subunit SecE n=1 Tax=Candidatus Profftia lariciata TaxID=1987921 RepID=UPI001D02F52C|nr:preprotein translocase subunit SecE [Candidatus Profftia lariciata]UDG81319.1 Protein translocase subunit SecE [Candidatus Profftia lariciata]